jgi:hypothetical protein
MSDRAKHFGAGVGFRRAVSESTHQCLMVLLPNRHARNGHARAGQDECRDVPNVLAKMPVQKEFGGSTKPSIDPYWDYTGSEIRIPVRWCQLL